MNNIENLPTADEFLFDEGLKIENYLLERTPFSEMVCYVNEEGREFDLMISNEQLKSVVVARLLELGVRVVDKS